MRPRVLTESLLSLMLVFGLLGFWSAVPHPAYGFKLGLLLWGGGWMLLFLIFWAFIRLAGKSCCRSLSEGEWVSGSRPDWFFWGLLGVFWVLTAVSEVMSVDPTRHGETSPVISQGPVMAAACLGIFLGSFQMARSWDGVRRLVVIAVVLGGILAWPLWLHRFGILPHGFANHPLGSFAGGPIYLAGSLIFLIPAGVWLLGRGVVSSGESQRKVGVVLLMVLMVGAFFLTEKRGPFLGLLGGGLVAAVLWGLREGKTGLLRGGVKLAAVAVVFLVILAVVQKSGFSLRGVPVLGRLAMIVPVGEKTGDIFRSSLWGEVPSLAGGTSTFVFPDGTGDPYAGWRLWVGYGPDTVEAVLPSRWVHFSEWPRPILEVSTHSLFWDTVLGLGLAGVVLQFLIFGWIGGRAMQALGLLGRGTRCMAVWLAWGFLGSVLGGLLLSSLYHAGYFGLGAQAGLLLGFLYVLWRGNVGRDASEPTLDAARAGLLVALLAGFWGGWIDMAFCFPTGNTTLLFCVWGGLILGISEKGFAFHREADSHPYFSGNAILVLAVAIGAVVQMIAFSGSFFVSAAGEGFHFQRLLWVGIPAWLFGVWWLGFLDSGEFFGGKWRRILGGSGLALLLLLACFYGCGVVLGGEGEGNPPVIFWPVWFAVFLFFGLCIVLAQVGGVAQVGGLDRADDERRVSRLVVLGFVGAAILALPLPLRFWQSQWAHGLAIAAKDPLVKQRLYDSALSLRPDNFRGRMEAARGRSSGEAVELLREGMGRSAFNLLSSELGERLLLEALRESNFVRHKELAGEAVGCFHQAGRYLPRNEAAWFLAGWTTAHLLGDPEAGRVFRSWADAVGQPVKYPLLRLNSGRWGTHYAGLTLKYRDTALEKALASRALDYLERSLRESDKTLDVERFDGEEREKFHLSRFWNLTRQAWMYERLGRTDLAAARYDAAARIPLESPPFDAAILADSLRQKR